MKTKTTKTYVCKCETCKKARAQRAAGRNAKAIQTREQAGERELFLNRIHELEIERDGLKLANAQIRHDLKRFEYISGRIEASKDATWQTGAGETIRVQAMNSSHLHYAIAKGLRGEYHAHRTIMHLENEALRRLVKGTH